MLINQNLQKWIDISQLNFDSVRNAVKMLPKEEAECILKTIRNASPSSIDFLNAWMVNHTEVPVDIDTFIENPKYLGILTRGGRKFYPFLRKVLRDIFNGIPLTKATITGNNSFGGTTLCVTTVAYILYRIMCLRDPYKYFGLKSDSIISFAFVSPVMQQDENVAYHYLMDILERSPWFSERVSMSQIYGLSYIIPQLIEIVTGSRKEHFANKQICFALFDGLDNRHMKSIQTKNLQRFNMLNTICTWAELDFSVKYNYNINKDE